jgi:hypothetical protein
MSPEELLELFYKFVSTRTYGNFVKSVAEFALRFDESRHYHPTGPQSLTWNVLKRERSSSKGIIANSSVVWININK